MSAAVQENQLWPQRAAALYGRPGTSRLVLVCEHASAFIPPALDGLGLSDAARTSHIAWDIGALDVARRLSARLDAPLVAGTISRLVYDCNRPLEAPGSIPLRSEVHEVPGNAELSEAERRTRHAHVHAPFHETVSWVLDAAGPEAALVTVHSFTAVYHGARRALELGLLFDRDPRLARRLCGEAQEAGFRAELNAPYGPQDGVMHTLNLHGAARGIPHVMIEVRNDLIDTAASAEAMADRLAPMIGAVCHEVAA